MFLLAAVLFEMMTLYSLNLSAESSVTRYFLDGIFKSFEPPAVLFWRFWMTALKVSGCPETPGPGRVRPSGPHGPPGVPPAAVPRVEDKSDRRWLYFTSAKHSSSLRAAFTM